MSTLSRSEKIGIFIHVFYVDLLDEVFSYLRYFDRPFALYISTDTEEKRVQIEELFATSNIASDLSIKVFPNIGRDFAPFLVGFRDEIRGHEICLRLHTKKSSHAPEEWGRSWRRHLFTELAGDSERINQALEQFERHPKLGVLVAVHWPEIAHWINSGANYEQLSTLLRRVGIDLGRDDHIEFPSGSMFWFRSQALGKLLDLDLSQADFAESHGEDRDATLAHALERSILYFAAAAGFGWAVLPPTSTSIEVPSELAIALLRDSGLFDRDFYLESNPDVAAAGVDPLWHYYLYGYNEGRDPAPRFETRFYGRLINEAAGEVNPLLYHLLRGRQRGLPTTSNMLRPDRSKRTHAEVQSNLEKMALIANAMP